MSLTLPYPDLDFVPLDVLTAEEMNQVVSNYTYISDQFPLTSDNIGQGAIKSQNIDWTTIPFARAYCTTSISLPTSGFTKISLNSLYDKSKWFHLDNGEIVAEQSGIYCIHCHCMMNTNAGYTGINTIVNNANVAEYWATHNVGILSTNNIITSVTAGQKIRMEVKPGNASGTGSYSNRTGISIFKIAG